MRPPWKIAYRTERHPISSRLIGDRLAEKGQSDDSKGNRRNGRHRPTRTPLDSMHHYPSMPFSSEGSPLKHYCSW